MVRSTRIQAATPNTRSVAKTSISDEIVDQLMELIARGDLSPGQRLPSERELCLRFGTGRSSMREALRCLSIVGVLNARVGEGTSIAIDGTKFLGKIMSWRLITEQHDVRNLMEVRIGLEGMAAASAARVSTQKDLAALEGLLKKMERCQDNQRRFSALDLSFHLTIARSSGNPLISDLISMIRGQLVRGLSRVLVLPNALPLSLVEHRRIVTAIRRHDPEGATKAMSDHLSRGLVRYQKFSGKKTRAVESLITPVRKRIARTVDV